MTPASVITQIMSSRRVLCVSVLLVMVSVTLLRPSTAKGHGQVKEPSGKDEGIS